MCSTPVNLFISDWNTLRKSLVDIQTSWELRGNRISSYSLEWRFSITSCVVFIQLHVEWSFTRNRLDLFLWIYRFSPFGSIENKYLDIRLVRWFSNSLWFQSGFKLSIHGTVRKHSVCSHWISDILGAFVGNKFFVFYSERKRFISSFLDSNIQ